MNEVYIPISLKTRDQIKKAKGIQTYDDFFRKQLRLDNK